jgi:hypothetical protein
MEPDYTDMDYEDRFYSADAEYYDTEEIYEDEYYEDEDCEYGDAFDDAQALASAGWGTDEDYGFYGDDY